MQPTQEKMSSLTEVPEGLRSGDTQEGQEPRPNYAQFRLPARMHKMSQRQPKSKLEPFCHNSRPSTTQITPADHETIIKLLNEPRKSFHQVPQNVVDMNTVFAPQIMDPALSLQAKKSDIRFASPVVGGGTENSAPTVVCNAPLTSVQVPSPQPPPRLKELTPLDILSSVAVQMKESSEKANNQTTTVPSQTTSLKRHPCPVHGMNHVHITETVTSETPQPLDYSVKSTDTRRHSVLQHQESCETTDEHNSESDFLKPRQVVRSNSTPSSSPQVTKSQSRSENNGAYLPSSSDNNYNLESHTGNTNDAQTVQISDQQSSALSVASTTPHSDTSALSATPEPHGAMDLSRGSLVHSTTEASNHTVTTSATGTSDSSLKSSKKRRSKKKFTSSQNASNHTVTTSVTDTSDSSLKSSKKKRSRTKFTASQNASSHMVTTSATGTIDSSLKSSKKKRSRKRFDHIRCKLCSFTTRFSSHLSKHIREEHWSHSNELFCKECIIQLASYEDFMAHAKSQHPKMLPGNLLPNKLLNPLVTKHKIYVLESGEHESADVESSNELLSHSSFSMAMAGAFPTSTYTSIDKNANSAQRYINTCNSYTIQSLPTFPLSTNIENTFTSRQLHSASLTNNVVTTTGISQSLLTQMNAATQIMTPRPILMAPKASIPHSLGGYLQPKLDFQQSSSVNVNPFSAAAGFLAHPTSTCIDQKVGIVVDQNVTTGNSSSKRTKLSQTMGNPQYTYTSSSCFATPELAEHVNTTKSCATAHAYESIQDVFRSQSSALPNQQTITASPQLSSGTQNTEGLLPKATKATTSTECVHEENSPNPVCLHQHQGKTMQSLNNTEENPKHKECAHELSANPVQSNSDEPIPESIQCKRERSFEQPTDKSPHLDRIETSQKIDGQNYENSDSVNLSFNKELCGDNDDLNDDASTISYVDTPEHPSSVNSTPVHPSSVTDEQVPPCDWTEQEVEDDYSLPSIIGIEPKSPPNETCDKEKKNDFKKLSVFDTTVTDRIMEIMQPNLEERTKTTICDKKTIKNITPSASPKKKKLVRPSNVEKKTLSGPCIEVGNSRTVLHIRPGLTWKRFKRPRRRMLKKSNRRPTVPKPTVKKTRRAKPKHVSCGSDDDPTLPDLDNSFSMMDEAKHYENNSQQQNRLSVNPEGSEENGITVDTREAHDNNVNRIQSKNKQKRPIENVVDMDWVSPSQESHVTSDHVSVNNVTEINGISIQNKMSLSDIDQICEFNGENPNIEKSTSLGSLKMKPCSVQLVKNRLFDSLGNTTVRLPLNDPVVLKKRVFLEPQYTDIPLTEGPTDIKDTSSNCSDTTDSDISKNKKTKEWGCLLCTFCSPEHDLVQTHIKHEHIVPRTFFCSKCSFHRFSYSEIENHILDIHKDVTAIVGNESCKKERELLSLLTLSLPKESIWRNVKSKLHSLSRFYCFLKIDLRHMDDFRYTCSICNKCIQNEILARRHVANHWKEDHSDGKDFSIENEYLQHQLYSSKFGEVERTSRTKYTDSAHSDVSLVSPSNHNKTDSDKHEAQNDRELNTVPEASNGELEDESFLSEDVTALLTESNCDDASTQPASDQDFSIKDWQPDTEHNIQTTDIMTNPTVNTTPPSKTEISPLQPPNTTRKKGRIVDWKESPSIKRLKLKLKKVSDAWTRVSLRSSTSSCASSDVLYPVADAPLFAVDTRSALDSPSSVSTFSSLFSDTVTNATDCISSPLPSIDSQLSDCCWLPLLVERSQLPDSRPRQSPVVVLNDVHRCNKETYNKI